MLNVIEGGFGKTPAQDSDLAKCLRDVADAVERGEVTELVMAFIHGDNYVFEYCAPFSGGVVLATMLQANCLDRMRT